MKNINKIRDYLEHAIDAITMAVFLLLFLVGLYALIDVQRIEASAKIDDEIAELAPKADDSEIDFTALREVNPEIIAWIRIDNTEINYPIVQAQDNSKYLVRDFRGNYATAGAIFLDYRNDKFNDDYSIIYGHRMATESMFGGIVRFAERDYFDAHPHGTLYTEDAIYDVEISDYAVINVNSTTIYNHGRNKNGKNFEMVSEIKTSAKQSREIDIGSAEKILVLSTCDKDSKYYRDILLTKLTRKEAE